MPIKLKWRGQKLKRQAREALLEGMEEAGKSFVYHIKASINRPFPPASAPGEPPRRRSGNLYRSVDYWVRKKKLEVDVGANVDAPYWEFLEDGTQKMEPRPFVRPAITRWIKNANRIIHRIMRSKMGFLK